MIGNLIKEYRDHSKLTLQCLSELSGISLSTISKLENNAILRPHPRHIISLVETLGIPIHAGITPYLDNIKNPENLKLVLERAIHHQNQKLVKKAAKQLLGCSRIDTFITLDYLHQLAGTIENANIRVWLYDTILKYARERGVPLYIARSLYEKYMLIRNDFTSREQSYQEGKEILHYINYLHYNDQIIVLYRLGLQAYSLKKYPDCLELCIAGLRFNQPVTVLQAAATLAICNSYYFESDYHLAKTYLHEYQKFDYPGVKEKAEYLRAKIYAKTDPVAAIPLLWECMNKSGNNEGIAIANDLFTLYLSSNDQQGVQRVLQQEKRFIPVTFDTPNVYDQISLYFRRKGCYLIEHGSFDAGMQCLMNSLSYYMKIGDDAEIKQCNQLIVHYHLIYKKNMDVDMLQALEDLYNGNSHAKI